MRPTLQSRPETASEKKEKKMLDSPIRDLYIEQNEY
jgi:hypothetical protein